MKTLMLFQAYKLCRQEMSWCEHRRDEGHYGIMVDSDHYAKQYQRYNRLAHKLNRVITDRLAQPPDPAAPERKATR